LLAQKNKVTHQTAENLQKMTHINVRLLMICQLTAHHVPQNKIERLVEIYNN